MAKKVAAKKVPVKKAASKKVAAKKVTSKKVSANKVASKKVSANKATSTSSAAKAVKKTPQRKEQFIQFWAMVTMKKSEAEIHMAFDAPISEANLIKWSTGYLAIKLKAQAMIIDENIYYDWVKESVDFFGTEDFDKIQDYPFLVQVDGQDEYYNLLLELNQSNK